MRHASKKDFVLINYQEETGEAGRSIEKQLLEEKRLSLKSKRRIEGMRMYDLENREADVNRIIGNILTTKSTVVLDRA